MDISVYIAELLFEHDCVIIPGFGGFVCSYKPAEIHPVTNTIAPPSRAITFNRQLQSNDGLLVNHIANLMGVSYGTANEVIRSWTASAQSTLRRNDEVSLKKVGKFYNDIEGNLQFQPDASVNYLKASFGLRTITAEPVLRALEAELKPETSIQPISRYTGWRVAAAVLLLACIASLMQLMWMGVEIKPLKLNEAGVFNFMGKLLPAEPVLKTIPVEVETPVSTTTENNQAATSAPVDSSLSAENTIKVNEPVTPPAVEKTAPAPDEHGYYIIVGVFKEEGNINAAEARINSKYPGAAILEEKNGSLTKIGFSAGTDRAKAKEQLTAAQVEDPSFWLMKK